MFSLLLCGAGFWEAVFFLWRSHDRAARRSALEARRLLLVSVPFICPTLLTWMGLQPKAVLNVARWEKSPSWGFGAFLLIVVGNQRLFVPCHSKRAGRAERTNRF